MEKKLNDIKSRVEQCRQAIQDRSSKHLEEITKQNKVKLEKEHKAKMDKLMSKLKEEEENYENMKKELIRMTKEKPPAERQEDTVVLKVEKAKKD